VTLAFSRSIGEPLIVVPCGDRPHGLHAEVGHFGEQRSGIVQAKGRQHNGYPGMRREMAEPDILTRMQMFINGEVLLSEPETRGLCRDAAAMLEKSYAKSGDRPDMEGLKRLALLHYIGKELLN
jgi:hypothetical protein